MTVDTVGNVIRAQVAERAKHRTAQQNRQALPGVPANCVPNNRAVIIIQTLNPGCYATFSFCLFFITGHTASATTSATAASASASVCSVRPSFLHRILLTRLCCTRRDTELMHERLYSVQYERQVKRESRTRCNSIANAVGYASTHLISKSMEMSSGPNHQKSPDSSGEALLDPLFNSI
jgi:hypothetical protein